MKKNNVSIRRSKATTKLALLLTTLILLSLSTYAAYIGGFNQLRYSSDFMINATSLEIVTANASRMIITDSGLTGIGTTAPSDDLNVVGDVNITKVLKTGGALKATAKTEIPIEGIGNVSTGRGMVLYMKFNNDSAVGENYNNSNNSIIYDYSNAQNNGTMNGSKDATNFTTEGRINGALMFDGADDHIRINDSNSLDFGTGDFSIETWINSLDILNSNRIVAAKQVSGGNWDGFRLRVNTNGQIEFQQQTSGGDSTLLSTTNITTSRWYHIAAVRSGTTHTIYINGVNDKTETLTARDVDNSEPLYIGTRDNSGLELFFNGTIDQLIIYNRSLSADEILYNYQKGVGGIVTTNNVTVSNDLWVKGKVGIGIEEPKEALHVVGNINATGNITSGIGTVFIDGTNNRVGIGTTTPNAALTVKGDLNVTGVSKLGDITINADNMTLGEIIAKTENVTIFNTSKGELVRIGFDGKVGIGITNATAFLDVLGSTASVAALRIHDGTAPTVPQVGDIYSDGTDLFFYDGTSWQDLTRETSSAGGWTDDGATVRLTSIADSIGIGTATPSEKFQVTGNGSFSGDLTVNGNLLSNGGQGGGGNSGGWTDDGTVVRLTEVTDKIGIGTIRPTAMLQINATVGSAAFAIYNTTGADPYLYINETTGNVGLGTGSPDEKLVVVGNINATGNITSGVDTIFIDGTNNRVGIGTRSPSKALTIVGGLNVTGTSYLGDLTISADNLTVNEIVSRTENISFFNSSKSEKMRILYDGKVGIGTTSPSEKLHIVDTGTATLEIQNNAASADAALFLTESDASLYGLKIWWDGSQGDVYFDSLYNHATNPDMFFRMKTSGTPIDAMTINADGNVGIGTTTPGTKLDITGSTTDIGDWNYAQVIVNSSDAYTQMAFANSNGITGGLESGGAAFSILRNTSSYAMIVRGDNGNVLLTPAAFHMPSERLVVMGNFSINNSAGTSSTMFVDSEAGNVGIGTTSPTHTLNVVGDINATGTIYRDGGTAVTDFVFDNYFDGTINLTEYPYAEGYKMVELAELRQYLHSQRHLPGLPGEDLTGQVDSAEVDRLLLEKVEELSIYIIELKKEKDTEIQELKTRIKALEANP